MCRKSKPVISVLYLTCYFLLRSGWAVRVVLGLGL